MKIAPGPSGRRAGQGGRAGSIPPYQEPPQEGPDFGDFEEEAQGKKRKKESKLSRFAKSFLLICIYVGIAVFLAYFALISASDLTGMGQQDRQIEVTIPPEAAGSISKVAKILDENGIISQQITFNIYAKFKKQDGKFLANTYVLNDKWGYDQIMRHISSVETQQDIVQVTIIEGYSQRQIGELLEENKVCSADDFYKALEEESYNYQFARTIPDDPLRFRKFEGYLFPDTYEFYVQMKPTEVAKKFFDNFQSKITDEVMSQIKNLPNGLGELDNLITLASLIQKEASRPEDMKMVSSVFHNRLNDSTNYPYLQSDATDNYIRDSIRYFMTSNNQEMYDAYDTKKVVGLPVGPICNPGMDAILAAINPSESDYYFFVSDDAGNYYYGTTNAEHEANRRKASTVNAQVKREEEEKKAQEETGE